jgi:hypothetical protein
MSDEEGMGGMVEDGGDSAATMDSGSQDTGVGSASSAPASPSEPTSAPAPQQATVWDAFRSLPDFQGQDDTAIARHLYASMVREREQAKALAQYQQHVPALREYYSNKPSYDQWLAAQRQQQAPAQPTKPKFWDPPQVKEAWKQYLVKDENGKVAISPDAPMDARDALMQKQQYVADFAKRFLDNPEEALGPMVQEIAQRQAAEIVQSQFQRQSEEQFVTGVEDEHSEWLFQDGDRNRPTQAGLAARAFVDEAVRMGIQDPHARWEYAQMKVEHMLQKRILELQASAPEAMPQQFAAPQQVMPPPSNAASGAEADMNYLRRAASRNPSRASNGIVQPAASQPMTFEQRLAGQINRIG